MDFTEADDKIINQKSAACKLNQRFGSATIREQETIYSILYLKLLDKNVTNTKYVYYVPI